MLPVINDQIFDIAFYFLNVQNLQLAIGQNTPRSRENKSAISGVGSHVMNVS